MTHTRSSRPAGAFLLLGIVALSACSSSGSPAPSGAPVAVVPSAPASLEPAPSTAPIASSAADSPSPLASDSSAGATPVPTSIDPCSLLTQAEATTLLGTDPGPGKSSTLENNDRMCSYSQGTQVLELLIAVEPDAATAKAGEPAFQATLEHAANDAGLGSPKLTELPNFEDGVDAALMSGSASAGGMKISAVALWALKGAVIVAISDVSLGGTPPSADNVQAQAHTTLARLP